MFLVIVIIILGACISIVWTIYFNTISMQRTYGSVNWYYWAYYWAMSSIERWLLMSKIKYPTYVWSWWFKWDQIFWAQSNGFSWDFWRLTQWNNSMMRYIDSLTEKIVGTIDTKTLRSISFDKYDDDNPSYFSTWTQSGTYWITDWLEFSWYIAPYSQNIWELKENTGESTDFNRFFSLKSGTRIVRWLLTTDTYEGYNEKDYQLTWKFNFISGTDNPRPALSWKYTTE